MDLCEILKRDCGKDLKDCTDREIYEGLLELVQKKARERETNTGKKKLYYISAEFLIGKLLSNNLINLGLYDEVKEVLERNGKSLSKIEQMEPEPSLGNGGLGRLAACFLDSIATLGLDGDGIGLNYHFGLFKQVFRENLQTEEPNAWIENKGWLIKTDKTYQVSFKDCTITSRMYDIYVTGYHNKTNRLHLFDVESIDESIVESGIDFDKSNIAKNLTLFLYPDDSDEAGHLLRIYQQYLMVSSGARLILEEAKERGSSLYDLPDYVVIQINDTHPSMVIPELIRLLQLEGMDMETAIGIVSRTCAYTNHTILAEALEKWPIDYLRKVVPQLIPIIEVLDNKVRRRFPHNDMLTIIDSEERVHMANMDIHYGFSVNGVASLHTDILKENELNHFYRVYPEKFNNKTNGITFRRWLLHCNPELTALITSLIGDGFKKDANLLERLQHYINDKQVLEELLRIKSVNKQKLKQYILAAKGIEIDENSIYDIQIKRLHEYKRQQMNLLYLIHKYLEIKAGKKPVRPITAIFGAKAAPAYTIAKDIIHGILCLEEIIKNDPEVNPWLKVVMVENYNVTAAEKLIPACDISEQISLASKEASGTGNMKFMLNGAVTLGTEDGANVEIHELVGDENIYIFGDSSDVVIERYKSGSYCAKQYYDNDEDIRRAIDFITGSEMTAVGSREHLERLRNELIRKDWFMTLPDFKDYMAKKEQAFADYEDRLAWAKKMLVNISKAGYFSSDRTIEEYNRDIWKLLSHFAGTF